jgi:hypothetical protein
MDDWNKVPQLYANAAIIIPATCTNIYPNIYSTIAVSYFGPIRLCYKPYFFS